LTTTELEDRMEHRRLLKLFVAPALALVLAACSTPGNAGVATLESEDNPKVKTAGDTKDAEAEMQRWTECMRENGVDIPDATVDEDGGFQIKRRVDSEGGPPPGGAVRLSDDFEKAVEECGDPPRIAGAGPSEKDLEQMQENALKLAQCMRDEGIEDFPDPDFSRSGPGARAGARVAVGGPFGGDVDMDSPEVQAAFEKCAKKTGGEGGIVIGRPARRAAG
jgi:hypothetical protein